MTERVPICELAIPIRWGDMDAMGHVNNTVYFRYMEQCRISWFGAMGVPAGPEGQGPIIVNASCNFRRELVYPGTALVRLFVGGFGRTSVETTYAIVRTDDPATVYADGAAKVVWVDFPKRRSEPWPDGVRQAILTPRGTLV
jgi:acyl-CoA thioester hydrolase